LENVLASATGPPEIFSSPPSQPKAQTIWSSPGPDFAPPQARVDVADSMAPSAEAGRRQVAASILPLNTGQR